MKRHKPAQPANNDNALRANGGPYPQVRGNQAMQAQHNNNNNVKDQNSSVSRTAYQSGNNPTAERADKACPCHQYLKDWLGIRKQPSDDDLAAATLAQILWESRGFQQERGLTFGPGDVDSGGVEFPLGGLKAAQTLAEAGIITLTRMVGVPIENAKALPNPALPYTRFLIDLPWLCEDKPMPETMSTMSSRKRLDEEQPGTEHLEKCCACHKFIADWLNRHRPLSQHDLAAALLIDILWETKAGSSYDGDATCEVMFEPGPLGVLGIDLDEAKKALKLLKQTGVISSVHDERKPRISGQQEQEMLWVEVPWSSCE